VKHFHVLGSHNTIVPCALPASLPDIVANRVFATFELELRNLLSSVEALYNRDLHIRNSDSNSGYGSDADSDVSNDPDDTQPDPEPEGLFYISDDEL
jgi:hypothetical protein